MTLSWWSWLTNRVGGSQSAEPLKPKRPRLRWGHVSITGNFRENNEDRFHIDPQGRVFLVADGMGGQSAGEKASEMASEIIPRKLIQQVNFDAEDDQQQITHCIDEAIVSANDEIMAMAQMSREFHGMGSTVALMVHTAYHLYVAGVGDSRIYQMRAGELTQLTTDHSLSEALRQAGTITREEAENHRYKHVLVRYLGSKEGGTGSSPLRAELLPGDRFLICSDGITDGLKDERIAELLKTGKDPQTTAQAAVAGAQAGGSKDNITCIVIFVD